MLIMYTVHYLAYLIQISCGVQVDQTPGNWQSLIIFYFTKIEYKSKLRFTIKVNF